MGYLVPAQTGREAGRGQHLVCLWNLFVDTARRRTRRRPRRPDLVHGFSDLPGGASGQGWWRATNGESPGSDLAMIDNANSQLGTSFPLFTGTTSGGGRVLLYDPATQGPYECVLVGGVWSYGLDVPCH